MQFRMEAAANHRPTVGLTPRGDADKSWTPPLWGGAGRRPEGGAQGGERPRSQRFFGFWGARRRDLCTKTASCQLASWWIAFVQSRILW